MKRRTVLSAVFVLMVPVATVAQTLTTFADLPTRLSVGDTVTVEQAEGSRVRGRVVRMLPDELVVTTKGSEVTLPASRVQRVSACCDGLRNGTLIGLSVGAIYGGLFAAGFSDNVTGGEVIGAGLFFGGVGTGLGVGLDALIRTDKTIYRASPVSVQVAVVPGRPQVGVTWSW